MDWKRGYGKMCKKCRLAPAKPRFDKRAYQREYMRKRRAGK